MCPTNLLFSLQNSQVCDGRSDCPNDFRLELKSADEMNCVNWTCVRGMEKCQDGSMCLKTKKFCDGTDHCADGSDEDDMLCGRRICERGYRKCTDRKQVTFCPSVGCNCRLPERNHSICLHIFSQCIPDDSLCDGKMNCNDLSDEALELCGRYQCGLSEFKCPVNKICIPTKQV